MLNRSLRAFPSICSSSRATNQWEECEDKKEGKEVRRRERSRIKGGNGEKMTRKVRR